MIVPFDFSHCFCGQCKVADKCLRHQVALRIPESRYSVPVINPNNVSPDGENCRYFKADRMAVYGLGISRMFDDLNYRKAIAVRRQVYYYFGRSMFYRILHKERHVTHEKTFLCAGESFLMPMSIFSHAYENKFSW